MIRLPNMLMIGSSGRNAGKTEFACSLIEKFAPDHPVVGVKVTAIRSKDGACPRGGKGCGVCTSLEGDYCLTEEVDTTSGKDTSRLLAAGAQRVFWMRVLRSRLDDGVRALLESAGRDCLLICESNSMREAVVPGLFIMIRDAASGQYKESAAAVSRYADRTIVFDGRMRGVNFDDIDIVDSRWVLRENATAIVLAGGESSRMKRDKALLPVGGRTMIEHIIDQLHGHFGDILVSANDTDRYKFLGRNIVKDRKPGQGPLMGIVSALQASVHDLNLVVACDMPEIDVPFARRMLSAADGCDAVVPRCGSQLEPLFAVYRKTVVPRMEELLASGERRIRMLYEDCRVRWMDMSGTDWLKNLNTIEEYQAYVRKENGAV